MNHQPSTTRAPERRPVAPQPAGQPAGQPTGPPDGSPAGPPPVRDGAGTSSGSGVVLSHPVLPRWAPALVALVAAAGAALLTLSTGAGPVTFVVAGVLLYVVALPAWSAMVENRRAAKDRLMTTLVWSAFAIALTPLVSLVWTVVSQGIGSIDAEFLTYSMRNIVGEGGGIYHAVIGTVLITGAAAVISIPVGVMTAVYLVEYGKPSRVARVVTFLVDVMTGIPSIVAGLFAYALFVLFLGPGVRMGIGGSVALSLLMVPIVVRATEEMLKLVPDELREASYALGVPQWRTIVKVVLPTSMAGIISGVTLALARVVGETAPLLIIAGSTDSVNTNLFGERMMTLPVFIYYSYTQPGVPAEAGQARAWGAALVLIAIVMTLNLLARLLGRLLAPTKSR